MKLGFIGLGNLGRAIAERLISQGVELVVWNRTLEKAQEFARKTGARVAQTPSELVREVQKVILILFDSQASEQVIFGKGGLLEGGIENKTIIDLTTNHFDYAKMAYGELKVKGAHYLDAPVLGSVVPARKGELTVVVGGDREIFEDSRDIFEKFCKNVFFVGEAGKASKVKLINNIVLGTFMDVLAEAVALAQRTGIGKEKMIEILKAGAGKSYILEVKEKKLLEEDFSPHFSVDLIYKDLHYAQDLLKDLGLFSFTLSAVKETYGLLRHKGLGDRDFSAIYKLFEE